MIYSIKIATLALALFVTGFGQGASSDIKLQVSATVVDFLEMVTLADIDVGTVIASEDILRLDPRTDQGAGLIKIEGRENSSIQVAYSSQVEMVNLSTNTALSVAYSVSGNGSNEQSSSELFTTNPETVVLNNNGEFFLWIGCSFSLADLVAGQYDGDFVVEVDYN